MDNLSVLSLSKIGQDLNENEKNNLKKPIKNKFNIKKMPDEPSSSKRDKFKSLAENRVNSVLNNLRLIGNLSNKSNYDYTSEDVRKINAAISKEFREMRERFSNGGNRDASRFTL